MLLLLSFRCVALFFCKNSTEQFVVHFVVLVYFVTFLGHKGHDESQRTQSEIPGKFENFRCFL